MRHDILRRLAQELRERRQRIFDGVARIEDDLRQCSEERESELEDAAAEAQEAQLLARLDTRGRLEIEEIDRALLRVAAGTYGRCRGCGEEISTPRLETLPATPFCFTCARHADRNERSRSRDPEPRSAGS
jgi:RNA polymerase-binding transcription factor DksA